MKASLLLVPVILCGGTGARLGPLSRATYPKHYSALAVEGEETLQQQTHQHLSGIPGLQPPLLICNEDHRFIVAEQMRQINVEPAGILLEPMGRNTAPAVAVAALQATARGDDPLLLVLAADHVIRDAAAFRATVATGMAAAEAGQLVTFGIVPTAPETGYGYIEAAEPLQGAAGAPQQPVPIARFVEKPDRSTAEQFLATGRFTWNTGMFLFKASAILSELERLAPDVVSACRSALEHDSADLDFLRLEREAFAGCPNVAIDVAVMERERARESKAHWHIYRPWGSCVSTTEGERWQGKKIVVDPCSNLTLQMRHHRAEHWILVSVNALVEKHGADELIGENWRTYIPLGCKHRITNIGNILMKLMQVHSGPYLGEDGIARLEDSYRRISQTTAGSMNGKNTK